MRSKWSVMFTLGLLLASCAKTTPPTDASKNYTLGELGQVQGVSYARTQMIVRYSKPEALQTVLKRTGGQVVDSIPELNAVLIQLPAQSFSKQLGRVQKTDSAKLSTVMYAIDGIVYAEPNQVRPRPDDGTHLNSLGASVNSIKAQGATVQQQFDGPNSLPQYALDANHLNAKAAWDLGVRGQGVMIGLIDDPSDVTHEDLAPSWGGKAYDPLTNKVYTSGPAWIDAIDAMDGKKDGDFDPEISHGTYTASTMISAQNGKGVVGVAPDAKFLPVGIFQSSYIGDFAVAKGIIWVSNNGAKVINNSWGGYGYGSMIKDAVDYALRKNIVVVGSAGNDGKDEAYSHKPSGYPGVIISAAASANKDKVGFSTFGRGISTVAPGHDVILASPSFQHDGVSSYGPISGTSFSAPYTSGAAALIKGMFPNATPYQVKRLLETTADDVNTPGYDIYTGYGHINVGKLAAKLKDTGLAGYATGGAAKINVQYYAESNAPGMLADVTLVHKDYATRLDAPSYFARTDAEGNAYFYQIEPGTYDVLVAGPDISLTGGAPTDRDSAIGTLVVGDNTLNQPATDTFILNGTPVNLDPRDDYEPNNSPATATPVTLPFTSREAFIYDNDGSQDGMDIDWYTFKGTAGQTVQIDVLARSRKGGNLDSYLVLAQIVDGKLVILAEHDDIDPGKLTDSAITHKLPADGNYLVIVSSYTILAAGAPDNSPFNSYILNITSK